MTFTEIASKNFTMKGIYIKLAASTASKLRSEVSELTLDIVASF